MYFSVCFLPVSFHWNRSSMKAVTSVCFILLSPWHLGRYVAHSRTPVDFGWMNGHRERRPVQAAGVTDVDEPDLRFQVLGRIVTTQSCACGAGEIQTSVGRPRCWLTLPRACLCSRGYMLYLKTTADGLGGGWCPQG